MTDYLDTAAVARRLGVKPQTVRAYLVRARRFRETGEHAPGDDIPAPDAHYGGSPVWRPQTIEAWIANRPGRGAGGGPKPPDRNPEGETQ